MDLSSNQHALQQALTDLTDLWGQVRGSWRDDVALRFEREHWRPNEQGFREYLRALEDIREVLEQAESVAKRF